MPRDEVIDNDALATSPWRHRFQLNDSPHVMFSCSSGFPHKIKFRKRVNMWPLRFVAQMDYDRTNRSFQYGGTCRDALLGGGLHLDLAGRAIEYRKEINAGPLSNLVLNGRCRYLGMVGGQPRLQPTFSIHVEMGRGAATWTGNSVAFKQEVPVAKHVRFEVCGTLQFPLPSVSYSPHHGNQQLSLGDGTYELSIDQLNPCISF